MLGPKTSLKALYSWTFAWEYLEASFTTQKNKKNQFLHVWTERSSLIAKRRKRTRIQALYSFPRVQKKKKELWLKQGRKVKNSKVAVKLAAPIWARFPLQCTFFLLYPASQETTVKKLLMDRRSTWPTLKNRLVRANIHSAVFVTHLHVQCCELLSLQRRTS